MTIEALPLAERGGWTRVPRVLALAVRELRGGIRGFHVFIACVALGVMAITAVAALSDSLRAGLAAQGEAILGGDATLSRTHARATPEERAYFDRQGRVSESAAMRTMARLPDGSDQMLVEIKAVDAAYPLAGTVDLAGGGELQQAIAPEMTAAVDPIVLERLGRKVGDTISVGRSELRITASIANEPDAVVDRLTYGPRVLVSIPTIERTGLIQPGSLVRWRYALRIPDATTARLAEFREAVKRDLPEAGFTVVDRRNPAPQVRRTLERLAQFLTLIGLTALLVGGVGVANAVTTFVDRRRKVIATMKSVGATSRQILAIFLVQVMAMAAIGVAIGLCLGLAVPLVVKGLLPASLPVNFDFTLSPRTLVVAAAYGFLVALLFTLWPLGRAEQVSATVLFRDDTTAGRQWPRPAIVIATAITGLVLVLLAVLGTDSPRIALYFLIGLAVVFGLFVGLGRAIRAAAGRVPRPRVPELALALGSIASPAGLGSSIVLSLGAGLSLLVAVALTDASLVSELTGRLPAQSPNYFVLDVAKDQYQGLRQTVDRTVPGSRLEEAPMLRGRLVRLKDRPVESIKAPPEAQWVLSGDRGLTYAEAVPAGSKVVAGTWWDKDYAGEPLVSFESELAKKLGVGIGDTVTVNVLGRNVSARISNLREVDWESLGINFVMVFSPNTLKAAPHNLLVTISLPRTATLADEARVARALAVSNPEVTAIRVKDALDRFTSIFTKIMVAVRVAGSITLLAGALVLAGALATAQRARILEAVILKTLGATRRRILTAHFAEYLILAGAAALLAVVLGSAAAWFTLRQVMEVSFTFSWGAVLQALGVAIGLVLLFGAVGTWRVLNAPAVPYLRSE